MLSKYGGTVGCVNCATHHTFGSRFALVPVCEDLVLRERIVQISPLPLPLSHSVLHGCVMQGAKDTFRRNILFVLEIF